VRLINPESSQIEQAFIDIKLNAEGLRKLLPPQRLVVVYLISGLAVNDGSNTMIINELDKQTLTYKLFRAEARIRLLARRFPESHHICLFANVRRGLTSFKLGENDRIAFNNALQSSLTPEIANEVVRHLKNPPDACTNTKETLINFNEENVNFGTMVVPFRDQRTFEINNGWDPIKTAEITQGIEGCQNYVLSFGLQPTDNVPFTTDKLVSEYLEALESQVDR